MHKALLVAVVIFALGLGWTAQWVQQESQTRSNFALVMHQVKLLVSQSIHSPHLTDTVQDEAVFVSGQAELRLSPRRDTDGLVTHLSWHARIGSVNLAKTYSLAELLGQQGVITFGSSGWARNGTRIKRSDHLDTSANWRLTMSFLDEMLRYCAHGGLSPSQANLAVIMPQQPTIIEPRQIEVAAITASVAPLVIAKAPKVGPILNEVAIIAPAIMAVAPEVEATLTEEPIMILSPAAEVAEAPKVIAADKVVQPSPIAVIAETRKSEPQAKAALNLRGFIGPQPKAPHVSPRPSSIGILPRLLPR